MELADLLKQLKHSFRLLVLLSVLGVLVGVYAAQQVYPHYTASIQLYLFRSTTTAPAGDFAYDGFYAQQFAEAYTDTAVGFVESTDTIAQAITDTESDISQLRQYRRAVSVEKTAPQLVQIEVSLKDQQKARSFALAVANASVEKINELNRNKEPRVQIELVTTEPLVQYQTIPFPLGGVIGLFVALFIGVSTVFFRSYLKKYE